MINGNYIGNKTTNESGLPYVIDMNGNIIVGKRSGNGRGPGALPTPHPTLIGGNDPQVQMAGLLKIGGCYIATAIYGSYDVPEVILFRKFRDLYLDKRRWGRRFVEFYYNNSPRIAKRLSDRKTAIKFMRIIFDKILIKVAKFLLK